MVTVGPEVLEREHAVRVKDAMTREAVVVRPDSTLRETVALLARHGVSGLPVVDDGGHVLGVVSEADILEKERASEPVGGRFGWLLDPERAMEFERKLGARTAGEAMSTPAISIEADRSVAGAAALMLDKEVNRLPVLENGRLVGVITRTDLLRAFARSDAEIAREIEDEVLAQGFMFPAGTLEVTVAEREVTLSGEVDTRTEAELVRTFVQSVPGVVSVDSRLTWRVDDRARLPLERQGPSSGRG